jgi:cytochrome b
MRAATTAATIPVWDPVVRVLHWTLAASVLGAFLLEDARSTHRFLGYVALAVVGVRLVWGVVGPRYARFADFVPGPRAFLAFLGEMARGREERHLGHNPAGAAMIVVLLVTITLVGITGWMMGLDRFWGADWLETLHEVVGNLLIGLVALHVGGVIWTSMRHGENLVIAMMTGRKSAHDVGSVAGEECRRRS